MSNNDDYEQAKRLIEEEMHNFDLTSSGHPTSSVSSTASDAQPTLIADRLQALKTSLLTIVNKKASPSLASKPMSIASELTSFLSSVRDNEGLDFQTFWKAHARSFPRLAQVARKYNAVPATSVYAEQLFSVGGAVKNIRRASLSSLSLRSLMILKTEENLNKLRSFAQ